MPNTIKYDVFISYSRKDYADENLNIIPGNEVSKIKDALRDAGISYWFDEDGIYSGNEFTDKIVNNIEASRIFLFLSTQNSCASPWTSKEIACADEYGKYIIPVRIDKSPYNKKVMFRIADLSYVDYSKNPEKGRREIVTSIRKYLDEVVAAQRKAKAEEERKSLELAEQLKRKAELEAIEQKISEVETKRRLLYAEVLQKEQELKLAQMKLEDYSKTLDSLYLKVKLYQTPVGHPLQITYTQSKLGTSEPMPYKHFITKNEWTDLINKCNHSNRRGIFSYDKIREAFNLKELYDCLVKMNVGINYEDIIKCDTVQDLKELLAVYPQ